MSPCAFLGDDLILFDGVRNKKYYEVIHPTCDPSRPSSLSHSPAVLPDLTPYGNLRCPSGIWRYNFTVSEIV